MAKTTASNGKPAEAKLKDARVGLILLGGWCLLLLTLIAVRAGGVGTGVVLLVSAALLVFQFRKARSFASEVNQAAADAARATERRAKLAEGLAQKSGHAPLPAAVMGGTGFALSPGSIVLLSFRSASIAATDPDTGSEIEIPHSELLNADITGPGTVVTNAGMIGGGFGIQGALEGILLAATINKLTTKVTTQTFLRLSTAKAEVHFLLTTVGLADLRMMLSKAVVEIEARRTNAMSAIPSGVAAEIAKLHDLRQSGALSEAEFVAAKGQLLRAQ